MRAPLIRGCLLSLLIPSLTSAVTMDWTPVGDPGNVCDSQPQGCFGAVPYSYYIGADEVTNEQYAEFLNAKAVSDPLALYSENMGTSSWGGITRSGSSGGYAYSAIAGRGNMPVNFVSFYDALRFANWMHNGQGNADTETGAYTLLGGTPAPSNGSVVVRHEGASIALSSEQEWYKAAYYDASTASYFDYPTGSDTQTRCARPSALPNRANCSHAVTNLTVRGSYTGSASPYGTSDQGGNVEEWNESIIIVGGSAFRGYRGGAFTSDALFLDASTRGAGSASSELAIQGFRLVMIPEPSTGMLVIAGLLILVGRMGLTPRGARQRP